MSFAAADEEYWRQRGRVRWPLKGDANTAYFHAIANGRRRKCLIPHLHSDMGVISEQRDLQDHIYSFYWDLMGSKGNKGMLLLDPNTWPGCRLVSREENDSLAITFLPKELDMVLADMKPDSAPGLDEFPVLFFK